MGETLAQRVISTMPPSDIDVVIPIPDSSRPSAMQLAQKIGKPYREGFVKNRYVGRTFIMPGQARAQEVGAPEAQRDRRRVQGPQRAAGRRLDRARHDRRKEIVQMAREAGAQQGLLRLGRAAGALSRTSTASTCRRRDELIAHGRTIEEIREFIGADALIYQDVDGDEARRRARSTRSSTASRPRASTAVYITGDVSADEFAAMAAQRAAQGDEDETTADRCALALQSAAEPA